MKLNKISRTNHASKIKIICLASTPPKSDKSDKSNHTSINGTDYVRATHSDDENNIIATPLRTQPQHHFADSPKPSLSPISKPEQPQNKTSPLHLPHQDTSLSSPYSSSSPSCNLPLLFPPDQHYVLLNTRTISLYDKYHDIVWEMHPTMLQNMTTFSIICSAFLKNGIFKASSINKSSLYC